jgi:hypothetical protein
MQPVAHLPEIILGNVGLLGVVVANVLCYAVKAAIRKKGYPVSWIHYPGMHGDFASLRKIIAAAESPEEEFKYRRWRRRLYLSYVVFGFSLVLVFVAWAGFAFRS